MAWQEEKKIWDIFPSTTATAVCQQQEEEELSVDDIDSGGSLKEDSDSFASFTDDESDEGAAEVQTGSSTSEKQGMEGGLAVTSYTGASPGPSSGAAGHTSSESACTCRALGEIYQDWCNRTRGKGTSPEDYFSTLLEHLATVKSSFDMLSITHPASSTKRRNSSSVDPGEESGQGFLQAAGGLPLCPVHGRPELPEKLSSEETALKEHVTTPNPSVQDEDTAVVQEMTAEEKKIRKTIGAANRKLAKVKKKIDESLKEIDKEEKKLDATVKWMDKNTERVEQAMMDHVNGIKGRIDYHHKLVRDQFNREQDRYWDQIVQTKLEVENYTSHLTSMQEEILEKFDEIKVHGLSATLDVPTLCNRFSGKITNKPQVKIANQPTYSVLVPEVSDEDISSLVGRFKITEDNATQPKPPSQNQAAGSKPGSAKAKPAAAAAAAAKGAAPAESKGKSSGSTPTKKKPEAAGSLGKKDKGSAMMTSSPSLTAKGNVQQSSSKASKQKTSAPAAQKANTASSLGTKGKRSDLMASAPSLVQKGQPGSSQSGGARPKETILIRDGVFVDADAFAQNEKRSAMMASATSLASSVCSSTAEKKKRKRARGKKKKNKAGESSAPPEHPQKPQPYSVNVYTGSYPVRFQGRAKQATSIAPRADGKAWVVYGYNDPHLDLLGETGEMEKTFRVGGNTKYVAYFDPEHILVASHSPKSQLRMYDTDGNLTRTVELEIVSTSLSIGCTGIVISSGTALYWIALDGGENQYIVPQQDSPLKKVCSTAVIMYQGRELVCAADRQAQAVYFYQKTDNDDFSPLPPYTNGHININEGEENQDALFVPTCLTSHPKGFLAILNEASPEGSVVILNVELQKAVRVIPASEICIGEPCVIAFGPDKSEDCPTLWAAATSGDICLTDLVYEYMYTI